MVYIVSTLLRKAFENEEFKKKVSSISKIDDIWKDLMLEPKDYGYNAVYNKSTRKLMSKCTFTHGGKEYDSKYPEGIPTSIKITIKGKVFDSGFIMFPAGHSKNTTANLKDILNHKNNLLGKLALNDSELSEKISLLDNIEKASNADLQNLYNCKIHVLKHSVDSEKFV